MRGPINGAANRKQVLLRRNEVAVLTVNYRASEQATHGGNSRQSGKSCLSLHKSFAHRLENAKYYCVNKQIRRPFGLQNRSPFNEKGFVSKGRDRSRDRRSEALNAA
ncbi:hypothetical protein ACVDG5_008485 [Mesorhizobium sp. ORM6]